MKTTTSNPLPRIIDTLDQALMRGDLGARLIVEHFEAGDEQRAAVLINHLLYEREKAAKAIEGLHGLVIANREKGSLVAAVTAPTPEVAREAAPRVNE